MPYRTSDPKDLPYEDPWKIVSSIIDWEIRDFCVDLHFKGYPVVQSCAGHPSRVGGFNKRGFIEFEGKLLPEEKSEVVSLARGYGLSGLRFWYDKKHDVTELFFSPIGFSDTKWDDYEVR